MTSRSRMKQAMVLAIPDKVPVWCPLSLEHIIRHGSPTGRIPETVEEYIEIECRLAHNYRFDGALLTLPALRKGVKVKSILEHLIYQVPGGDESHDFTKADPDKWLPDLPDLSADDFFSAHLAREILGENIHIGGWMTDGFSKAMQWFPNLETGLIALIEDVARFKAMVEYFDEWCMAQTRAQVRFGKVESIQISSPYAGAPFFSPEIYHNLVLPSVKKMATAVRTQGAFSYLHTCGHISDRLELMAGSGIHGIECMDPTPLGDVELRDAKARVGDKIFLKGNIDSVNVLLRGTVEDIKATVRSCLSDAMKQGGYILSTACSVAPAVTPERVKILAEVVNRYGSYEI